MNVYLIKKDNTFSVMKCSGFTPKNSVGRVPDSIDPADYPFLYGELLIENEIETWVIKIDEIAKGEALAKENNKELKAATHASYIADIDAEMKNIFGTINRDKANSLYNSWYEWMRDPSYFADKGLVDDLGVPLDTSGKVYNYSLNKINQSKDYSVFLITRERQFRQEIAGL